MPYFSNRNTPKYTIHLHVLFEHIICSVNTHLVQKWKPKYGSIKFKLKYEVFLKTEKWNQGPKEQVFGEWAGRRASEQTHSPGGSPALPRAIPLWLTLRPALASGWRLVKRQLRGTTVTWNCEHLHTDIRYAGALINELRIRKWYLPKEEMEMHKNTSGSVRACWLQVKTNFAYHSASTNAVKHFYKGS